MLSDNEAKMQTMLDCMDQWCSNSGLAINFDKSKVIHFRNACHPRTEYNFHCGQSHVDIIDQYKYLGGVFTEHLDFMQMSKTVAQSASRALGLLISKDKYFGGMPFECFTQCYNATVQAIIDYSAQYVVLNLFHLSMLCRIVPPVIFLAWTDMHQMPLLMVTWVGLHQNTGNGCVSQESGADMLTLMIHY